MKLKEICWILSLLVVVMEMVESRKMYEYKQYTYRKKRDVRILSRLQIYMTLRRKQVPLSALLQCTYIKKKWGILILYLQDRKYKNAKALCDTRPECLAKYGAEQSACVRKCISEFCYNELYAEDPVSYLFSCKIYVKRRVHMYLDNSIFAIHFCSEIYLCRVVIYVSRLRLISVVWERGCNVCG